MGLTFGGQALFYFIFEVICVYAFLFDVRLGEGSTLTNGFGSILIGVLSIVQLNYAHLATEEVSILFY